MRQTPVPGRGQNLRWLSTETSVTNGTLPEEATVAFERAVLVLGAAERHP
jgi:hypothetical protein